MLDTVKEKYIRPSSFYWDTSIECDYLDGVVERNGLFRGRMILDSYIKHADLRERWDAMSRWHCVEHAKQLLGDMG